MSDALHVDDLAAEVESRLRLAEIAGTAQQRRALRRRLGLSIRQVAELTGLHPASVCWRESDKWRLTDRGIESDAGFRYIEFLAQAKGIKIDV